MRRRSPNTFPVLALTALILATAAWSALGGRAPQRLSHADRTAKAQARSEVRGAIALSLERIQASDRLSFPPGGETAALEAQKRIELTKLGLELEAQAQQAKLHRNLGQESHADRVEEAAQRLQLELDRRARELDPDAVPGGVEGER